MKKKFINLRIFSTIWSQVIKFFQSQLSHSLRHNIGVFEVIFWVSEVSGLLHYLFIPSLFVIGNIISRRK